MEAIKFFMSQYRPGWGKAIVITVTGQDQYGHEFGEYHVLVPEKECLRKSKRFRAERPLAAYLKQEDASYMQKLLMRQAEGVLDSLPYELSTVDRAQPALEPIALAEAEQSILVTVALSGQCSNAMSEVRDLTRSTELGRYLHKVTGFTRLAADEL